MSAAALSWSDVRKTFRGAARPAVEGVTLEAGAGRALVLLGASGSGKTTLLRLAAGLERTDAGHVALGERVLSAPRVHVAPSRRGIGLVFQELELWPHMTVAENVAFGLPGRPQGRAALRHPTVGALADRVGIPDLLARRPDSLSGGERQRVAIARALAPDPTVILYDEPLANLDPERRADLRALIRELWRERGATLVYVTHDADEAMEMGEEVAVLQAGRLVERGAPHALWRTPRTLAGARALGPVNAIPARAEGRLAHTALGALALAEEGTGEGFALLRPEAVRPVAAVPGPAGATSVHGVVVEVFPRGAQWAFAVEASGVRVLGRSPRALAVGERVDLSLDGPAAYVPREVAA